MSVSINNAMIEELKDLMEDEFPVLVVTFLTDCDERLIELSRAIAENNALQIREVAHGFKGSSSNLGADKLSEICYALETMGRNEDLVDVKQYFSQLEQEYLLVKAYFNSIL